MSGRVGRGRLGDRWTIVDALPMYARVSSVQPTFSHPSVVLVHGLVVSGRYMIPTAERLAAHYRVYVPDLPGFGLSVEPRRILNTAELSDALASWMQANGLHRAVLLGNSFGCQIIAEFALRHPEKIQGAVLVGPTVDPRGRTISRQIARWLIDGRYEPLPLLPIVVRDYLDTGLRRAVRTFQYALEDRIEEKLPHLRVPTLVVRGSRDVIVPQLWAEEATRLLPEGRLVVIPGAPHAVNYAASLELVRIVRPFLSQLHEVETRKEAA